MLQPLLQLLTGYITIQLTADPLTTNPVAYGGRGCACIVSRVGISTKTDQIPIVWREVPVPLQKSNVICVFYQTEAV